MKKTLGITATALFITFAFVAMMNASTYWSTLSLGTGRTLKGATRAYTAGINAISINPYTFEKANGLDYTKLEVALYDDVSTANPLVGTVKFRVDDNKNKLRYYFGDQPAGNRYYKFSTKVDGFNYGGVTSEEVLMMSFE